MIGKNGKAGLFVVLITVVLVVGVKMLVSKPIQSVGVAEKEQAPVQAHEQAPKQITAETGELSLQDQGSTVIFSNAKASFTLEKSSGKITSAQQKGGGNLLGGGGEGYYYLNYVIGSKKGAWSPRAGEMTYRLIASDNNQIELSSSIHNPGIVPFDIDLRFVLRAGVSGLYHYEIYKYSADMPDGAAIEQARYAYRADPKLFKNYAVDDKRTGTLPTPEEVKSGKMITDATYKLSNGSVYTKYMAIQSEGENNVYGLYGDHIGLSLIKPNNEFVVGGPTKQELTLHQTDTTPILLWHPHTAHYGTPDITPKKGWEKIYGPMLLYIHEGNGLEALWEAAKAKAKEEKNAWPYAWLKEPLYAAASRGTVTGQISIADGTSMKDAWVILGASEPDWQLQNQDYLYYTKADASGKFTIPGVRPGTYTLYSIVKGAFGQYRYDGVKVEANQTRDVGVRQWTQVSGKRLWQIGIPDRSAAEFRHGDDYHQFGLWFDYPLEFPNDVNFYVGKSVETKDWNYFQPAIHTPGDAKLAKVPSDNRPAPWFIHFPVTESLQGKGIVTIAIAGAVNGSLKVDLNGKEIAKYATIPDGPASDASYYRSAVAGIYRELHVSFDAGSLQQGDNVITLSQLSKSSNAGILYDAIRLEVTP